MEVGEQIESMIKGSEKLKVALIGCGAIAETGHLPGSRLSEEVEITVLIDRNLKRAKDLAKQFGIAEVADDASATADLAEVAVICTQPSVHGPIAIPLLENGISTLVEKPITATSAECELISAAADRGNAIFAAAMVRRFAPSDLQIKSMIESEVLGKLVSFKMDNGYPFSWPSATNFILSKSESGGGVLMGLGSHMFDSMLWLMGDVDSFRCYSDAKGGLETECLVELVMKSGAKGTIELSRSRQLDNRYNLEFENGSVKAPYLSNEISVTFRDSTTEIKGGLKSDDGLKEPASFDLLMAKQLDDFARAVRGDHKPMAPGNEVRDSIALIEACYENQEPLACSWSSPILIPDFN